MVTEQSLYLTGSTKNGEHGIETGGHETWTGRVATSVYKHKPENQMGQPKISQDCTEISENKLMRPHKFLI